MCEIYAVAGFAKENYGFVYSTLFIYRFAYYV